MQGMHVQGPSQPSVEGERVMPDAAIRRTSLAPYLTSA